VKAGGLQIPGQPGLYSKFLANLGYVVRLSKTNIKQNKKRQASVEITTI
jgi:hypothetical protein